MPDKMPRSWQEKGFVPFWLEVLTPVYIGSNDELSPLDYVIRKMGNQSWLCCIDLQGWLMQNADDSSVQKTIANGDVAQIRNMLQEKVDPELFGTSFRSIDDTLAQELLRAYGGNRGIDRFQGQRGQGGQWSQSDKKGEVALALRNPVNDCPYIPGSSLKGAISTPLINSLDLERKRRGKPCLRDADRDRRGYQDILTEMFGRINKHAMQALKLSDCMAMNSACHIVRAVEQSRNQEKKGTPKKPCEAIMPTSGPLWGRMMLDSSGKTPAITLPDDRTIEPSALVKLCNDFYLERFWKEMGNFYQLSHFVATREALQKVADTVQNLDGNTMLLRVGHYSHVECVTVENNRPPTPYGTTRTLANGVWPFGWVLIHFCTVEDYIKGIASSEEALAREAQDRRERLLELRNKAVEAAQKAVEIQAEILKAWEAEEQKAREKEKEEAELARCMAELSPEEARLLQLQKKQDEALSMQIYKEMQGWQPDMKAKAAEALKNCWSKLGKWDGSQSKKQQEKIRVVKALLTS